MSLTTVFAAVAAMAVNFGWQKADDGYEYLVQLEPETLQLLHEGVDVPIDSHVPEGVQPIRRVRIVVGKAELPRAELTATEEPRTGEAVERSAYWRPGDSAPQGDGRYPAQQPPAAQPSAIDTMVEPLRKVDNFVEQGFEKGVDGLEKTGQTLRDAVGNVGSGVQEHLQRGKDAIFGAAPSNSYSSASAPPTIPATSPAVGAAPAWQYTAPAPINGNDLSMSGLPSPPLAGAGVPATSMPAVSGTDAGASGDDWLRFPAAPGATDSTAATDSGSRMVAVEPVDSDAGAARVPAWDPNWPTTPTLPVSSQSGEWPERTTPAPATSSQLAAQPMGATGSGPSQMPTPPPAQKPTVSDSAPADVQSLGGWALAIIGLAGSIGCNFFLGFSYLDIRNKYRAALRRTSRSFGRPAASA